MNEFCVEVRRVNSDGRPGAWRMYGDATPSLTEASGDLVKARMRHPGKPIRMRMRTVTDWRSIPDEELFELQLAESLEQMRRGEGHVIRERPS